MSLRCPWALPEVSYENQILFGHDKGFVTGELVIFRLRKRAILAYCISTYGQSIDGFWLENRVHHHVGTEAKHYTKAGALYHRVVFCHEEMDPFHIAALSHSSSP